MRFRSLRRGAVLVLFAGGALFVGFRVPHAYSAWRAKNEKIRALQRENAELRKENERRRAWIQEFKNNKSEQERVLRKHLQKQREGDTTFMLGK